MEIPACLADTQIRRVESREEAQACNLSAIQSLTMLKYDSNTNSAKKVFSSSDPVDENYDALDLHLANREKILQEGDISPKRNIEQLQPYSPKGS